jgi:hypothetical protein
MNNKDSEVKKRFEKLNKYRVKSGLFSSSDNDFFGLFFIKNKSSKPPLKVLCSPFTNDHEWEHVSVSRHNECPSWDDMCFVKGLFWGEDETVVQFHPPKSEYVNNHPYCLHLWRHKGTKYELPPSILVGLKELNYE